MRVIVDGFERGQAVNQRLHKCARDCAAMVMRPLPLRSGTSAHSRSTAQSIYAARGRTCCHARRTDELAQLRATFGFQLIEVAVYWPYLAARCTRGSTVAPTGAKCPVGWEGFCDAVELRCGHKHFAPALLQSTCGRGRSPAVRASSAPLRWSVEQGQTTAPAQPEATVGTTAKTTAGPVWILDHPLSCRCGRRSSSASRTSRRRFQAPRWSTTVWWSQ